MISDHKTATCSSHCRCFSRVEVLLEIVYVGALLKIALPHTRVLNTTATRLPCRDETSSSRVTFVFSHNGF